MGNNGASENYAIKRNVDFKNVASKLSFITPVPGGVGLMTIAALLNNMLNAYEAREAGGK